MARFLAGTIPFVGSVGPLLPIVRELVGHGHEVRWHTGSKFWAKIEARANTAEPNQFLHIRIQALDADTAAPAHD